MGTVYRIVMRGELSQRFAPAFEGMEMETEAGMTVLTGNVADQPRLHGILDRIGDLGLKIVSVDALSEVPPIGAEGRLQTTDQEW